MVKISFRKYIQNKTLLGTRTQTATEQKQNDWNTKLKSMETSNQDILGTPWNSLIKFSTSSSIRTIDILYPFFELYSS